MRSQYFPSAFGSLHYRHYGVGLGSPLVMVHGLYPGASHEEFEHNVSSLSRDHEIYAMDLLGFGLSAAPNLNYTAGLYSLLLGAFIDTVVAAPAAVITAGQSAAYAAHLAVVRPDLVRRLVCFSPFTDLHPGGLLSRFTSFLATLGSFYDTVTSTYEITEYLKQCFADPRHITRPLVERLTLNASRKGSEHAYGHWLAGDLDGNLPFYLPRTSRPTLILTGDHSPKRSQINLTANCLTTRVIPDAGTWLHDEKARTVNQIVGDFLAA